MRTNQPLSEAKYSRYADSFLVIPRAVSGATASGGSKAHASRASKLDGPFDPVEKASRILAQAFGYGDSWFTADVQFDSDSTTYADGIASHRQADGLPIARRTETLEKADKAANVGEFHHWQRAKGIAVMPRVRPQRSALIALSDAKLDGPLEDWLLLYALQDWSRWLRVRRYAIACRPHSAAVDDAAQRIVWRRATIPQDERAKLLGVNAESYRKQSRAAEFMLTNWLDRAASQFIAALDAGPIPPQISSVFLGD